MRVNRILAVSALAVACARDAPMAPAAPPTDPTTEQFAALADAITDAQVWLLPVAQRDVTADAIAERFADLASSLARAGTGFFASRIAAARQEPGAGPAEEPGERLIQLAALGLGLEGGEAGVPGK